MTMETNIYPIEGLEDLSTQYTVFRMIGLSPDSPDYFQNLQILIDRLSRSLRSPVTTIRRDGASFIVIPTDAPEPPIMTLVRTAVRLDPTGETIDIDFTHRCAELDPVRQRFLQFAIQAPLRRRNALWQPKSGQAFFEKKPEKKFEKLDIFRGASIRVVPIQNSGWGVCVDIKTKFVHHNPLSANIDRSAFNKLKGRTLVYQFGHIWYEVKLQGLPDYNVSEELIIDGSAKVSLLQYLNKHCQKPVPERLSRLNPNGQPIYYSTTDANTKTAPAELCFLVEDTHGRQGARLQKHTILPPHIRRAKAVKFVNEHLHDLRLGNVTLSVNSNPETKISGSFEVPDFEFGNGKSVSVRRGNSNAIALRNLGYTRKGMLVDSNAGFYSKSLFTRQYLVVPQTIANACGDAFTDDLRHEVNKLYPNGGGYDPEIIVYDDLTARRSFVDQAKAIKTAMVSAKVLPGHALVMIHNIKKGPRKSDQVEAMIVKDFPIDFGLNASVIHTDTSLQSYVSVNRDGSPVYVQDGGKRNKLLSYLRNVALSKVILANGKIPFIVKTPLNADLIVGIDVKLNTAALSLVVDGGKVTFSKTWGSRQKERLTSEQLETYLQELVLSESENFSVLPKRIVVHRDGRAFPGEIEGLSKACIKLAEDGHLADDFELTIVEIKKSGPVNLRLLYLDGNRTNNPRVGTYYSLTNDEGFVCTTGEPFRRQGTTRPLHVIRAAGNMPIEQCMEDIFFLACLSWSRPEDCSRLPISIVLCDRVLFEDAADYDADSLNFSKALEGDAAS